MSDGKLKTFVLVTKSHERMFNDWFLSSLPSDCRLVLNYLHAEPTSFRQGEWHKIFAYKLRMIIDAIEHEPPSSIIAVSDVDIQFFQPFANDLRRRIEGQHIVWQNNLCGSQSDPKNLCGGFVGIRCCDISVEFFKEALRFLEQCNNPGVDDQVACASILYKFPQLKVALLPDLYWTSASIWFPGTPLSPPPNIIMHHANWVLGIENKIEQLRVVRDLVETRGNNRDLIREIFTGMDGGARCMGSDMAAHMPSLFLLARCFSFGEIVELGVGSGFSSVALLSGAMSAGRILASYDIDPGCVERAVKNMDLSQDSPLLSSWRFKAGDSIGAAEDFQNGSVSLMFLDTAHTFEITKAELQAWVPKIHPKGIICGHDYHLPGAGVHTAVEDLLTSLPGRFRLQVLPHDHGLFILWPGA